MTMDDQQPHRGRQRQITQRRDILAPSDRIGTPCFLIAAVAGDIGPVEGGVRSLQTVTQIGREGGTCKPEALLLADPHVSRRHALIEADGAGSGYVTDLGSSNGTFLNGQRIAARTAMNRGDWLRVGDSILVFEYLKSDQLLAITNDMADPVLSRPTLSGPMALLCERLRRIAKSDIEVLLTGESGSGKEVMARALHRLSGRPGAFLAINCASIPENLLESELFGFARGAHSTATHVKPGLIEQADGGTLFLDEIGDMSMSAQAKLLRFLQDHAYVPLGATSSRKANTRIVAATRLGVSDPVHAERGLRVDLAARLGPEPLVVPPLRQRREDLPNITLGFLSERGVRIHPDAVASLFQHSWPGNVRELVKTLELAMVLAGPGNEIACQHLPLRSDPQVHPVDTSAKLGLAAPRITAIERPRRPRPSVEELSHLLKLHRGDVAFVARALGRQRTLVWRWVRQDRQLRSMTEAQ